MIRLKSGDECTDEGTELVTDDQIQTLYDDTGSECGTIVGVIQIRLAYATKKTGVNETTGQTATNPATVSIKAQLDYWQSICPESWATLGKSTVDLGIDEEIAETS
jgi:hypothetical protein